MASCICSKTEVVYSRPFAESVIVTGPGILWGPFASHIQCTHCRSKIRIGPDVVFKGAFTGPPYRNQGTKVDTKPNPAPKPKSIPDLMKNLEDSLKAASQVEWVDGDELPGEEA